MKVSNIMLIAICIVGLGMELVRWPMHGLGFISVGVLTMTIYPLFKALEE